MRCDVEKIVAFINIFFSIIFMVHIGFLGYNILYPVVPEILVYKKNFNEIDFPMTFRLCAFELYDKDARYQAFGYKDYGDFFRGESMFNSSLYGWAGHTENGTALGNVQGKIYSSVEHLINR